MCFFVKGPDVLNSSPSHGHAHKAVDADQGTMSEERVECSEA